ncbi:MAG: FAD-dependent oxidoreductase [Specibacter sp.]
MNQSATSFHPTDVLIVGAGITGLTHAAEAVARGLSVRIIDRDTRAVDASIGNFGHCCVGAQSGGLLELATVAREGWLRHSGLAGFFAVESGSLAVARNRAEVAVLEELSATHGSDRVQLINATQVRAELSGHGDPAILAGALLRDDIRVDPREAVGKLAAWLAKQPNVTFLWRTSYFGTDSQSPSSGAAAAAAPSSAPDAGTIRRAILTGTSMVRYPAFAETSAAVELKNGIGRRQPGTSGDLRQSHADPAQRRHRAHGRQPPHGDHPGPVPG